MKIFCGGDIGFGSLDYAKGNEILQVKQQAEISPPALKKALIEFLGIFAAR